MKKIRTIIFFFLSIFAILTTTSCNNQLYVEKEEYVLQDKYEIYENIKYYYSSLGLIAKEVVTASDEVTIYPSVNGEVVYSVATDFLKDNTVIKVLNLPNSGIIYEKYCVSNCINLKEINFKNHGDYGNSNIIPVCEKNAFDVSDDCYFYVYNIEEIQHYVYAFNQYVSKFKLLNPVKVEFSLSAFIIGSNFNVKEKNLSFSVNGKAFGIIDINASQSYSLGNPWYCQKTVNLIDDVDFFIKNGKKVKPQEFIVKTNVYILAQKNIISGIVTKDYPISSNKTRNMDNLYSLISWSEGSNPGISASFSIKFSYSVAE